MGQLRSGPHVVGRLRSGVWVSASFQIFALTAGGEMSCDLEGNCPSGIMPGGGNMSEGIWYTHTIRLAEHRTYKSVTFPTNMAVFRQRAILHDTQMVAMEN